MDHSQLLRVYIIEAAQGYAELSRIYIDRGDKASYYFLPMGDLTGGFATLRVEKIPGSSWTGSCDGDGR